MYENILKDLPMGFGMALAENLPALERFAAMDNAGKARVVDGTHTIRSKTEMRSYVAQLADQRTGR